MRTHRSSPPLRPSHSPEIRQPPSTTILRPSLLLPLLLGAAACTMDPQAASLAQGIGQVPAVSMMIPTAVAADQWSRQLPGVPVPKDGFACEKEGLFADPLNCADFYQCILIDPRSGEFLLAHYRCASGTVFNAAIQSCDFPANVPGCEDYTPPKV